MVEGDVVATTLKPAFVWALDSAAVLSLAGYVVGALPSVATALTVLWVGLRCCNEWLKMKELRRRGHNHPPASVPEIEED